MIGFVHLSFVSTKIAISKDLSITVVGKYDQTEAVKNCFLTLGTPYERYKLCDYVGHANQPHLAVPCADSTVHA